MSKWKESWGIVLRGTQIFRSRWSKWEKDWQRGWRRNRSWSYKSQARREFQRQELVRGKAVALETGFFFFFNVFKCFCERNRETQVWSLGWEDPLEEEMVTHSSILAWEILWTEEPSGLQSMGSQRVGHDWNDWAWKEPVIRGRGPEGIEVEKTSLYARRRHRVYLLEKWKKQSYIAE